MDLRIAYCRHFFWRDRSRDLNEDCEDIEMDSYRDKAQRCWLHAVSVLRVMVGYIGLLTLVTVVARARPGCNEDMMEKQIELVQIISMLKAGVPVIPELKSYRSTHYCNGLLSYVWCHRQLAMQHFCMVSAALPASSLAWYT